CEAPSPTKTRAIESFEKLLGLITHQRPKLAKAAHAKTTPFVRDRSHSNDITCDVSMSPTLCAGSATRPSSLPVRPVGEPCVAEHAFPREREALRDDFPLRPACGVHACETVALRRGCRFLLRLDDVAVERSIRHRMRHPVSLVVVEHARVLG